MSDRFRLGIASGPGGFFGAALLDTQTGAICPFRTVEAAETALQATRENGFIPLAGYQLEFTPIEEATP